MGVELNHTIVWATDRGESAGFPGLAAGPFLPVRLARGNPAGAEDAGAGGGGMVAG